MHISQWKTESTRSPCREFVDEIRHVYALLSLIMFALPQRLRPSRPTDLDHLTGRLIITP